MQCVGMFDAIDFRPGNPHDCDHDKAKEIKIQSAKCKNVAISPSHWTRLMMTMGTGAFIIANKRKSDADHDPLDDWAIIQIYYSDLKPKP